MNIGYVIRPDFRKNIGGDTIQATETARAVERLGVNVRWVQGQADLAACSLVHAFNLWRPQESYWAALACRKIGRPLVVSPIYWTDREFESLGAGWFRRSITNVGGNDLLSRVKYAAKGLVDGFSTNDVKVWTIGLDEARRRVLSSTAALLPNAHLELEQIRQDLGNFQIPYIRVVRNGVEPTFSRVSSSRRREDAILCVARVEPRKNLEKLASACGQLGVGLVVVGAAGRHHRQYAKRLLARYGQVITFMGEVDHAKLPSIYAEYKVHALISWFETPGLSSLEAAAAGCNIVVSDRGSVREYFGGHAFYCAPADVDQIVASLRSALSVPFDVRLRNLITDAYTWDVVGKATVDAYREVLANDR